MCAREDENENEDKDVPEAHAKRYFWRFRDDYFQHLWRTAKDIR